MFKQLRPWIDKFDAMNDRERISIMLLLVVGIIIIFVEIILSPISQKYDAAVKQTSNLAALTQRFESKIMVLKSKRNRDPDFHQKNKIKLLDEQLANINLQLKEKMRGLIEPKQMAKALEVVLAQNTDLTLQRIESLGAKPLTPIKGKEGEVSPELGIYRHGLKIEFSGTYLSTLKYLKALKKLPWNFYWDVLELNVEKYPDSKIVITVHTLSFNEGWIGV